jgi:WXG100 family type VII secretion target
MVVISYTVEPGNLQRLDAVIGSAADQASVTVERIRLEAQALFATGWHGPAASAFRLGWEQWLAGATTLLAVLHEMAELLGRSAAGYAGTEEAVRVSLARESA